MMEAPRVRVGQAASVVRVFHQEDFERFAALSGDDNPIHVDPAFSARTRFGRPVAHGMLLYGAVLGVLGTRLPGPGTVPLSQDLIFPSPTYAGEEVTVRVALTAVSPDRTWATLETVVVRPDGEIGCQGAARVALPAVPDPFGLVAAEMAGGACPADSGMLKGLRIGQRAEARRVFTPRDLAQAADLTGDANPVTGDPAFARRMGLRGPIVPGSLLGGLFSYLLGTHLPGRGTNYLKQRLVFPAPAYPGQEITGEVVITRLRPEKELVNLRTRCTNPAGDVVCHGEALVLVRDVPEAGNPCVTCAC
jgi:acyl dehydratase